jgi:hypothetical protein
MMHIERPLYDGLVFWGMALVTRKLIASKQTNVGFRPQV